MLVDSVVDSILRKRHTAKNMYANIVVYMSHEFWMKATRECTGLIGDFSGPIDFYNSGGQVLLGCPIHVVTGEDHPHYRVLEIS